MAKNPELQFNDLGNIDELINDVEQSTASRENEFFSEIDSLCDEIDIGIEKKVEEIKNWPKEKKRKEVLGTQDEFVLNLLSMDEDLNIRCLAVCSEHIPSNSVRRIIEKSNDYIRMLVANNHSSNITHDILDRIFELTKEPEVITALKNHPNLSLVTKYKIENQNT